MHTLQRLVHQVNKTHHRLGSLVAMCLLVSKAGKCMLVVAPAGTGKSTATDATARGIGGGWVLDSVTRSSLQGLASRLNGFDGLIVIDDLGKVDTKYSRVSTVTTFAELCYSHFVEKYTITTQVSISGFVGAALMNIQPNVMAEVVASNEWESVIMDKTIRWYHLYRPVVPCDTVLELDVRSDVKIDDVELTGVGSPVWLKLARTMGQQWSDARLRLHIGALLRSAAAWDGRQRVNHSDYRLLAQMSGAMAVEKWLISKFGLETDRVFELNLTAMLVELASWDVLTVDRICRDYKVSPQTVERVVGTMPDCFRLVESQPGVIWRLPKVDKILEVAGVRR